MPHRFLVDENLPVSTPSVFNHHGYQVTSVRSLGLLGATDQVLMNRAYEHDAIIVSRDKDFGDIIRYPRGTHPGAMIIRLPFTYTAVEINERIDLFRGEVDDTLFDRSIIVLERGRYRVRSLDQ